MRSNALVLFVSTVMFFGAAAPAQTPQQRLALIIAEEHWIDGNFLAVRETLKVHRDPESDKEFLGQVGTLLENQSSERAVMVALMIHDDTLRNRTLLGIMNRQLYAPSYMPEKFDMMIGKAEKTAQFLTDVYRDSGYAGIASNYFGAGKSESAWEAMKQIDAERFYAGQPSLVSAAVMIHRRTDTNEKALDNAKRFREWIDAVQAPGTKAKLLLNLVALYTEHSAEKAQMRKELGLSSFAIEVPEAFKVEFQKKRLEVLEEASALILSLQDTPEKVRYLQQTRHFYHADGLADKAKVLDEIVLTTIENIDDAAQRFRFYAELFDPHRPDAAELLEKLLAFAEQANQVDIWRTLFEVYSKSYSPNRPNALEVLDKMYTILERMEKTLRADGFRDGNHHIYTRYCDTLFRHYVQSFNPHRSDTAEILERLRTLAGKLEGTSYERTIITLERRIVAVSADSEERRNELDKIDNELFEKDRRAILDIGDQWQRLEALKRFANHPTAKLTAEQNRIIQQDILEILFTTDGRLNDASRHHEMLSIFYRLRDQNRQGQDDKMQEAIELFLDPRMPDAWKPSLVEIVMQAFFHLDNGKFETRKEDFWKMLDLLESPQAKFWVLDDALVPWIKLNAPEDWKKRLELASEITEPRARFNAFENLLSWTGKSYREATWMNGGKEYRPMLLEEMAKVAESETDPVRKAQFYGKVLSEARRFALWDAKKLADWQEQYNAMR